MLLFFSVAYSEHDCLARGYINISGTSGVIASAVTMANRQGKPCPWRVEAEPYQRINITLVDFSKPVLPGFHSYERDFVPSIKCEQEYAMIVDLGGHRNVTVCSRQRREATVYLSRTNKILIHIIPRQPPTHFLLKYNGTYIDGHIWIPDSQHIF